MRVYMYVYLDSYLCYKDEGKLCFIAYVRYWNSEMSVDKLMRIQLE